MSQVVSCMIHLPRCTPPCMFFALKGDLAKTTAFKPRPEQEHWRFANHANTKQQSDKAFVVAFDSLDSPPYKPWPGPERVPLLQLEVGFAMLVECSCKVLSVKTPRCRQRRQLNYVNLQYASDIYRYYYRFSFDHSCHGNQRPVH